MTKLWSNEDLLGLDERELLVEHHRMYHCSFKYLLRLSKRWVIPRKLSKTRKLPPFVVCLFRKSHKRLWSTKGKRLGGTISKISETRPRAVTSIDRMFYSQPGLNPQINGSLTHSRFWEATVFVDHYYDC